MRVSTTFRPTLQMKKLRLKEINELAKGPILGEQWDPDPCDSRAPANHSFMLPESPNHSPQSDLPPELGPWPCLFVWLS